MAQGGEHPDRPVQAGHHVEDGDARSVGRPVGLAGEAHQPGDGLHDEVVPREPRPSPAPKPVIDR